MDKYCANLARLWGLGRVCMVPRNCMVFREQICVAKRFYVRINSRRITGDEINLYTFFQFVGVLSSFTIMKRGQHT